MAFVSIDARFKPLSLDEYLKPALMHQAAYEQYDQGLEDLATDASKYSQYIPKDSQAYATQQQYMQELKDVANTLYNEGMNINNNFSTVRGLRKQYLNSILPINSAAQTYAEQAKVKQELQAKGFVFYNEPTFDELVINPTLTASMYNSDKVYTAAANMAKALSSRTPLAEQIQHLDKYNMIYRGGTGLTEDHVQLMLSNPEFQKQLNTILIQNGIDGTKMTDEQYQQAMNTALNGAYSGFTYNPKEQLLEDKEAVADLNIRKSIALENAKTQNAMKINTANSDNSLNTITQINNRADFQDENKITTFQTLKYNDDLNQAITNTFMANINTLPNKSRVFKRIYNDTHKDVINFLRTDKDGSNNFDYDTPIKSIGFDPYLGENQRGEFFIVTEDGHKFRITNDAVFGADMKSVVDKTRKVLNILKDEISKYPEGSPAKTDLEDKINKQVEVLIGQIANDSGVYRPQAKGDTSEKANNVIYK